jgi:hypothetical protein
MKRKYYLFFVAITSAACLIAIGFFVFAHFFGPPSEITDARQYPKLLADWSASGLVAHFPSSIPSDAINVRLSAYPGYLQGPPWFQIRMTRPPDQVQQIEGQCKKATTHIYIGGDEFTHFNKDPKNNWPTTVFHTTDNPSDTSFPDDYTLYVLHAVDHGQGSWDPHDSCGIAINRKSNDVVYWADR